MKRFVVLLVVLGLASGIPLYLAAERIRSLASEVSGAQAVFLAMWVIGAQDSSVFQVNLTIQAFVGLVGGHQQPVVHAHHPRRRLCPFRRHRHARCFIPEWQKVRKPLHVLQQARRERKDAEERARREADEKARREAEEKARRDAEEAQREAEWTEWVKQLMDVGGDEAGEIEE